MLGCIDATNCTGGPHIRYWGYYLSPTAADNGPARFIALCYEMIP